MSTYQDRPAYWDRAGKPISLDEWAARWEDYAGRVVAMTIVGDATVLTLWIGRDDDPFLEGPPLIFGSIIKRNGTFSNEVMTPTEDDAYAAHTRLETVAREFFIPDGGADVA